MENVNEILLVRLRDWTSFQKFQLAESIYNVQYPETGIKIYSFQKEEDLGYHSHAIEELRGIQLF